MPPKTILVSAMTRGAAPGPSGNSSRLLSSVSRLLRTAIEQQEAAEDASAASPKKKRGKRAMSTVAAGQTQVNSTLLGELLSHLNFSRGPGPSAPGPSGSGLPRTPGQAQGHAHATPLLFDTPSSAKTGADHGPAPPNTSTPPQSFKSPPPATPTPPPHHTHSQPPPGAQPATHVLPRTNNSHTATLTKSNDSLPPPAAGAPGTPLAHNTSDDTVLHPFFGRSVLAAHPERNLVFRHGAHGIPKRQLDLPAPAPEDTSDEVLRAVSVGEDAYFMRSDALGIADGVGGLSHHAGTDSGKWSQRFMHHCCTELERYDNVDDRFLEYYDVDPKQVLLTAYEQSMAEARRGGLVGSSTGLVAVLRRSELRIANIGDGWCGVIRGDDLIFNLPAQQHKFNHPVQVGTTSKDTPLAAREYDVPVQKDDIVILASDGLVDNLFDEDVLEEVMRFVRRCPLKPASPDAPKKLAYALNYLNPQQVSEALCTRAFYVYADQRTDMSPFQKDAIDHGVYFVGGKPDDITTLVAVVGELESAGDRNLNL